MWRPELTTLLYVALLLTGNVLTSVQEGEAVNWNQFEETNANLMMAVAIFRHGERAPNLEELYPCDPYKDVNRYYPEGFGNLVLKGRQNLYELGKFLRQRYSSFLPYKYHYKDINITSSDIDRTITSAQCVLAGLYLPQKYDLDRISDIVAPVIPIHSINMNNDMFLRLKKKCDKYGHELETQRELKYNETLAQMRHVYDYLSKHSCKEVRSLRDLNRVYSNLLIVQAQHYSLPEWATSPEYPATLIRYLASLNFYMRANTDVQRRLVGGPLITQIIDSMIAKKNGTLENNYKMLLFSGHDTTIAVVLHTLGYEKFIKPNFGASVLFELHCVEGQYYVRVLFKPNGFSNYIIPIEFSQCHLPSSCTLDEFYTLNLPWRITLDEWIKECAL